MKKNVYRFCFCVAACLLLLMYSGCASAAPATEAVEKSAPAKTDKEDRDSSEAFSNIAGDREEPPSMPMLSEAAPDGAPGMKRSLAGESEAASAGAPRSVPSESGLRAGYSDDNAQYGYFVNFLSQFGDTFHYELDVSERIQLNVIDSGGIPVPNALISITRESGRKKIPVISGKTLADGTYYFFPADYRPLADTYAWTVKSGDEEVSGTVRRDGPRTVSLSLPGKRSIPQTVPVDVLFILDTTGSMGEEIQRLKNTIELIYLNLKSLPGGINPRFGMVLYKDFGDEYVTKTIPLTADLETFQRELDQVYAGGGGDTPEELQAALEASIRDIQWNSDGIRLGYIITDAPPQFSQTAAADGRGAGPMTYAESARLAKQWGIKYFSVGTGGLDLQGEYVLRQVAQYTGGRYIFLTYGESGESEGGAAGSVSHHTGANFQTDKLESIIIRFTKEEISSFINQPLPDPEPYIEAVSVSTEQKSETLGKLFGESIDQLFDYSSIALDETLKIAVLPIQTSGTDNAATAEYFSHELLLAAGAHPRLSIAERDDLQKVLDELKLQLSGITDAGTVTSVGELLNADYLLLSDMIAKDDSYTLYMKLLRVKTGEVLSVTKAVVEKSLGL